MKKVYVINYEYANEKYDVYEKGSVCAYMDLKKAQKKQVKFII